MAFASVVVNILLAMFYNTVIAWAVYYLYLSFRSVVPWQNCGNPWNTVCCFPLNQIVEINNGENTFYNRTQDDLIYRRDSNKFILYNHKNFSQVEVFQKILNASIQNNFVNTESYNETSNGLAHWLKLYYIYLNETLINAPFVNSTFQIDLDIQFDTEKAVQLIESTIESFYKNASYNVIIDCSKDTISPTQEFYSRFLTEMHKSRGLENIGGIKWEVAFSLLLVFVTVYFALWKGIKSAGKAVWITAIAPYVVMVILLIRGLMLDGWQDGVEFYLGVKDWYSILDFKVSDEKKSLTL